MSALKPLKLYSHAKGPNPWKVAIILNELELPYETEFVDFADLKKTQFTEINPNGRLPALQDPNTGITLWESGAIIDYLVGHYDAVHKISYNTFPEKYLQRTWEHFQMSGQGPYFGQKAWFTFFHAEKNLTSAIERYGNEIRRVHGVINAHLENSALEKFNGPDYTKEAQEKYPTFWAWHQRLMARPSVVKAFDEKAKLS